MTSIIYLSVINKTTFVIVYKFIVVSKTQEKLRKMIKIRKSQLKMGVFEKSREKIKNLRILSALIYQIPYIYKPSNGKK